MVVEDPFLAGGPVVVEDAESCRVVFTSYESRLIHYLSWLLYVVYS
jgi:hypothetical protein